MASKMVALKESLTKGIDEVRIDQADIGGRPASYSDVIEQMYKVWRGAQVIAS